MKKPRSQFWGASLTWTEVVAGLAVCQELGSLPRVGKASLGHWPACPHAPASPAYRLSQPQVGVVSLALESPDRTTLCAYRGENVEVVLR